MAVAQETLIWSKRYDQMQKKTYITFSEQTDEVCIYQPDFIGESEVILDFADLQDIYKKIKKLRKKHES